MSTWSLRSDLMKAKMRGLTWRRSNEDVVISKADKGDSTVIMATEHYAQLARTHLNEKDTYKLLKTDRTPGTRVELS